MPDNTDMKKIKFVFYFRINISPNFTIKIKKMANFNIVSARVPTSVYNGLKAILDSKNITISDFIKSEVDRVLLIPIAATIIKKTDNGFLTVLGITSLAILGVYSIVKIIESNNTKKLTNDR